MLPAGEGRYALIGSTTQYGGGGVNAMLAFVEFVTSSPEPSGDQPHGIHLAPVSPNPFNPSTDVEFSLSENSDIHLAVYDIQGRLVRTLLQGSYAPGVYRTQFDASDAASGPYFVCLDAEGQQWMRKMTLLK